MKNIKIFTPSLFLYRNTVAAALLAIFLLYPFTSSFAQWAWAVKSNGTGYESAFDVESDANGNNYMIGDYSSGTSVFGATTLANFGNSTCFLAKTDVNGAFLWAVRIGGTGTFLPHGEAVTTNGTDVFVTGTFRGSLTFYSTTSATVNIVGASSDDDCFIAKYNASGVVQWAIKYGGGSHQKPMDIAISTATQRVFVTGSNGNKIFINSYNFNGVQQWSVLSVNTSSASGMGIRADAAGNSYIISKYALGPISLPGTAVFTGTNNMLLAKYNLSGAAVWTNNIGGAGSEVSAIGGIGLDGPNNLYIAGNFTQTANISGITLANNSTTTSDLFIAKYDNNGVVQWAKAVGGTNSEDLRGLATDNAGNSFIVGHSQENNSVSIDCQTFSAVFGVTDNQDFVIKYDNAGTVAWAQAPSVNDQTTIWGITTNGNGYAVVAGQLLGAATFGTIALANAPATNFSDALVFKVKKAISSDFTLLASFPAGSTSTYQLTAVPAALPASFWWEVSEIDVVTGAVIAGTTMTNPANWWVAPFIANNTFPGYCCNPTVTSGYGTFTLGRKYRITRGTWGTCIPWDATSKTVFMSFGARTAGGNSLLVDDDPSYVLPSQIPSSVFSGEDRSGELEAQATSADELTLDVKIFPNPNTGMFSIQLPKAATSGMGFRIVDLTGQVRREQSAQTGSALQTVEAGDLPSGLYFLQVVSEGRVVAIERFVKQ